MKRKIPLGDSDVKSSKNHHDTISEQEFTIQERGASTDPQEDSPGDSEKDAGEEFLVGMNYQPLDTAAFDDDEKIQIEGAIMERPNDLAIKPEEPKFRIPSSAMVKSSEQPAPWQDKDRTTSRN